MSLSDPVGAIVAAVVGSGVTGTFSVYLFWRQSQSPRAKRRVKDAWQAQAKDLQSKLEQQYEARISDLKEERQRD